MKQAYIVCFSILWIMAIFSDYWNKHLLHQQGFNFFDQWPYLIGLAVLTLGSGLLIFKGPQSMSLAKRPVMLLPYFIILTLIAYLCNTAYSTDLNENQYVALTSGSAIMSVLWKSTSSLVLLSLIWIAPYSLGHWIRNRLGVDLAQRQSFTLDFSLS